MCYVAWYKDNDTDLSSNLSDIHDDHHDPNVSTIVISPIIIDCTITKVESKCKGFKLFTRSIASLLGPACDNYPEINFIKR